MRNLTALLLALLIPHVAAAQMSLLGIGGWEPVSPAARPVLKKPAARFVTGFNQGWLHTAYGSQWTTGFDEAEARRLIAATRDAGGGVLRLWLFEGLAIPRAAAPEMLANLERVLALGEEHGVKIYLTFFDANVILQNPTQAHRDAWWNLLSNDYGQGDAFLENVARPVLQVAARHPGAMFGLDLMNEHNAMVQRHWFRDGWTGARAWIAKWRTFVKRELDTPVTASFGWGDSVDTMLAGHLTDADVDFWDFHVYDAHGDLPRRAALGAFVSRSTRPVWLGEFGQSQPEFDDALQARVTERFLREAHAIGCAGALAWRLSDIRPGFNAEARHSYEAHGRWRPAMDVFRRVSAELAR